MVFLTTIAVLGFLALTGSGPLHLAPQDATPTVADEFELEGETMERDNGIVRARGNVTFRSKELTIQAETVEIRHDALGSTQHVVHAVGNVVLTQEGNGLGFHRLRLELGTGHGEFELRRDEASR